MIRTALKLLAYAWAPKASFTALHPVAAVQVAKTPFDLRTAYAPRLAAAVTALVVAPLAYRLGRRAGERALPPPR